MIFEILNDNNEVINTIVADIPFVEEHFQGRFRQLEEPIPSVSIPSVVSMRQGRYRPALEQGIA